jgi:hypothetical protein
MCIIRFVVVASLCIAASTARADLVAYYNFDNVGNLGEDTSGNGNNLTAVGAPVSGTGVFGTGLTLNNSDALVSAAFPAGVPTGGNSYSLSAWVHADVGGADGIVGWGNYGTGNAVNALRTDGTNGLNNYWWSNDLIAGGVVVGGDLIGEYHHVAATYDATTGQQRIYVDGLVRETRIAGGQNVAASNFAVGRSCDFCGGGEFFDGNLDDVAVYNTALSADQVYALGTGAAQPHTVADATTNPLVALYRFEDGTNVGLDSSVRSNQLTAFGDQVTFDADAAVGGAALRLGGSDDYLALADGGGTELNNATPNGVPLNDESYSISLWAKPDAGVSGSAGFIGWGDYGTSNEVNAFRLNSNDGLNNYWWSNDLVVDGIGIDLLDGEYHHLVATYDNIADVHNIYVDGMLVGSRPASGHNTGAGDFRIGVTNLLNEDYLGLLDDIAIFNRALTMDEITAIQNGDFSAFLPAPVPEPASVLLWSAILVGLAGYRRYRRV